ncbi:hypothetical protein PG996_014119 [Apiospora saccharicola]|uniref:Uncharacterized protein n=1 Tax=Apiospora saccharicola TaxID=335842 RepID=A0ABR1TJF5_9PEZI
MGKQKKQGSHTVPERGKAHPHHHHHHQQRPEAPAHDGAFNPAPAWSPVMLTESFAYTALQGPNGQPLGWRISGIDAYTPSNARSYPAAWASAPAYGTYLAPQNVPTAAQQPGAGISAGASASSSDRGGDSAHTNGGSDTGSGSDDSGSASHSEVRKKKGKVKSSGHRHRHSSRQPSRHRQHRSRSAHRSRAHGHGHHAGKEAQSQHKVHRWLDDDTF